MGCAINNINRLVIVGGGRLQWPSSKGKVLSFILVDDYEQSLNDYNSNLDKDMYQNYFLRSKQSLEHNTGLEIPAFNLVQFLPKPELIVFGHNLENRLFVSKNYLNPATVAPDHPDYAPKEILIPHKPLSLTRIDGSTILVLYRDHQPVTRTLIKLSPSRQIESLDLITSQSPEAIKDLSCDSLEITSTLVGK